jgi:hypothetical protein
VTKQFCDVPSFSADIGEILHHVLVGMAYAIEGVF